MRAMLEWLKTIHTPEGIQQLVAAGGLLLLAGIVFAETGILAGFFLPGDSLLVTAGVLCAVNPFQQGQPAPLEFWTTGAVLSVAAVIGDWLNFWFGKMTGAKAWEWKDGRLFKRRYLDEAHQFYVRWGGIAIAAGRFVPIVRTFVPFVAGMARMPFRTFSFWNVIGGLVWVWSLLALGRFLGTRKAMVENLHLLILVIIGISFIPLVVGVIRRLVKGPTPPPPSGDAPATGT